VKLAFQRTNLAKKKQTKKENEELLTFERLVSVVRKQLSVAISNILSNGFKMKTSFISNTVTLGCFKDGKNSDKAEVIFYK
jgi:hypothetical protein